MAIRTILRMGDQRLLEPSQEITDIPSIELEQLFQDMLDTMEENNGAGLAAPQIGVSKRLVVFGMKDDSRSNERYPETEHIPLTILINPEIEPIGDEIIESWEGCLSIPGMRGLVPRYLNIRYKGIDPKGNTIEREVKGFHAVVVQHECDHLDGILYPMRMPDMSYFGFESELSRPDLEQQADNAEQSV